MGVLEDRRSKVNPSEYKGEMRSSLERFSLNDFSGVAKSYEMSYSFDSLDINNEDLNKSTRKGTYLATLEESNNQKLKSWPKGFISAESWSKVTNLHSRIAQVTKSIVSCECLIDKENQIFEVRDFPKEMFTHFDSLFEGKLVLISLKTKPGSSRIDIHEGDGLVDKSLFDLEDEWKELENSDLGKPLDKPIKF